MWLNYLAVFIGGGVGCICRYYANLHLPYPTFIVNILGCFVIGVLFSLFTGKISVPSYARVALSVGFCGGISTFSSLSLELIRMFENGQIFQSILYIILSLVVCLSATALGVYLGKTVGI